MRIRPLALVAAVTLGLASHSAWGACDDAGRKARGLPPCSLDAPYRTRVEAGMAREEAGDLEGALAAYLDASRVKRYEAESYYALLDAGRVQYKLGRYRDAIENLTAVLSRLDHELQVAREEAIPRFPVPGFTVESLLDLMDAQAEAEALITASRARLRKQR